MFYVMKMSFVLKNYTCKVSSLGKLRFPTFLRRYTNPSQHGSPKRNTIFALSTAPGIAAVSIVRVSGPDASAVFRMLAWTHSVPTARKATLCRLREPESGEILDRALALWFPSPNSFTGEDVCELHIHGGNAVVKSVLGALQKLPNFRHAEPGEFTKRAFLSGKLDLTEVEGLADLLRAETEAQRRQALFQMDGSLHRLYTAWSGRLKQCLARMEAYIDFSEDQHLDGSIVSSVTTDVEILEKEISAHLSDKRRGEKLRTGVQTILLGKPNVGKSSLLNNLCQSDIAIVSPTAGTTRDLIEASLNLGGHLVTICDTAGIRETVNDIEEEGVRRAMDRFSKSDLVIFITEAQTVLNFLKSRQNANKCDLLQLLQTELGKSPSDCETDSNDVIIVANKSDLLSISDLGVLTKLEDTHKSFCSISCTKGTGIKKLVNEFAEKVAHICGHCNVNEPVISNERQRHHLEKCLQFILEYKCSLDIDVAISAEKLRNAMNELGKITGKVRTEDILDVVFRDFCIGK